ncbi:MauE/DoxX family redox-associated membrane protein [Chitinophaga niabensis]|uniref:Methylamine utilisation protein MauE n=1 Tax=Chitinophaga niabensis TaxID=536979 RepID=A0A1N6JYQ4_9BACT|nr:MauE/DoxX family redox-associated membrane protein [Chitinophaga niabensis]SIO49383.1 Methylamine utilisation protein MauE [Chitinophaga niabensis]
MKKRNKITEAISAIFIFLFVYTALSKIFTFNLFSKALKETPLIGGIATYIAFLLPAVELTVSLLLLIPRTRRLGLYSTFALMLVFTLYIGYMIIFTPQRPCTCGGVLEKMTWTQHLIFNIFFTILSFTAILMNPRK